MEPDRVRKNAADKVTLAGARGEPVGTRRAAASVSLLLKEVFENWLTLQLRERPKALGHHHSVVDLLDCLVDGGAERGRRVLRVVGDGPEDDEELTQMRGCRKKSRSVRNTLPNQETKKPAL